MSQKKAKAARKKAAEVKPNELRMSMILGHAWAQTITLKSLYSMMIQVAPDTANHLKHIEVLIASSALALESVGAPPQMGHDILAACKRRVDNPPKENHVNIPAGKGGEKKSNKRPPVQKQGARSRTRIKKT